MAESFRRYTVSIILLLGISFLGSYFALPLLATIDFIFGSIATLILIAAFGSKWGLTSALLSGFASFLIWNHPYGAILLLFEAVFVSATLKRFNNLVILSSAVYWALIGIPLCMTLYHFGLGLDWSAALLVALKQSTNGIFNATIAALILANSPIRRLINYEHPISALQKVFNLVVAAVLFPALIILFVNSRGVIEKMELEQKYHVDTISKSLSNYIQSWKDVRLNGMVQLANIAQKTGIKTSRELQIATELATKSSHDYASGYVADALGTTVTFYPEINERGEKTIGMNFSDRAYYEALRLSEKPVISDVFMGRGGVFAPIITMSAPIIENGTFKGYSLAAVNLAELEKLVSEFSRRVGAEVSLLSQTGRIIASTREEEKIMSFYSTGHDQVRALEGGYYHRTPDKRYTNRITRVSGSYFGKRVSLTDPSGWKLVVETSLAPNQDYMHSQYLKSFLLLLVLLWASLLIAYLFSRKVSEPLVQLAKDTTDLPAKLSDDRASLNLPTSNVAEVQYLVKNFKLMAEELKSRFRSQEEILRRLNLEIRERRRAEDKLRSTNRLKDEFLASVSHELRTPLNVIGGYLEIIQNEGVNNETPSFIEIISRNVRHLGRLIEDLLDVSRISSGSMALDRKLINLERLAEEAVEAVRLSCVKKGLNLSLEVEPGVPQVEADPARMLQVFTNLLGNSVKFTPQGGEIKVVICQNEDRVEIKFSDTGEGINSEFLSQIFNRFQQENGSLSRIHGGLGIGLAIVREIVELHGGTIRAYSPGKNQGATFIVSMPVNAGDQIST